MSLMTTRKGDILLEFHPGDALHLPEAEQAIPMPLALVVAKHQGKILFIFNRWRETWELPGGMIDDGETPQVAAIRELAEETGQVVACVHYEGWMKFQLKPDDRLELGVLYSCQLETLQAFTANEEVSQIMLWDSDTSIEGDVAEIDLYLANVVK